jgi:hypothetical protein
MDEKKLINLVLGHERLYNLQHKDCDNNLIIDNSWKEIAGEFMRKILNFHEGHGTVEEWQGNGMVCVNRPLNNGRTAGPCSCAGVAGCDNLLGCVALSGIEVCLSVDLVLRVTACPVLRHRKLDKLFNLLRAAGTRRTVHTAWPSGLLTIHTAGAVRLVAGRSLSSFFSFLFFPISMPCTT